MKREVLVYGVIAGVLIAVLKLVEYRFLVVEHSIELYGGLIAGIFAVAGIWLGLKLTKAPIVIEETPAFQINQHKIAQLGLTPRELEILQHIAAGLSNKEIAAKLYVSENTVKTHSSRIFDKLNARRRTQAVQIAKQFRLIE